MTACGLRKPVEFPSGPRSATEGGEQYAGYLSGILSDRMSGLCRYFVGPYVGIASGLCRYCVGTMSGVMSDYTGVMSGPRASQGGVMCLRKGHLDPA